MSSFVKSRNTASVVAAKEAGTGMALSTGAIAGIAIAGAVILFAALAPLLIKLAKKQDQRRMSAFSEVVVESGDMTMNETGPRRLRKKSIIGDQVASMMDKDDEVGMEESKSRRSSLNVGSPARTRPGSFSGGDGSGRGSVDTQQGQKPRSPDKERGYDMYQNRRKASWIDEDALHGPTVTSPRKSKQKHNRIVSWFDGGLGRSLSRLSTRSGIGEMSPTLPYTETGTGQQENNPGNSADEQRMSRAPQDANINGYAATPRQSQHQSQVYTSPQKMYGPSSNASPGSVSNSPSKSPPDIIHNPRYRNRVSFQAAQQLAGGARLPAPISIPQGQTQRQPILKHSATDTELTEILRMTAERLQDGHRSARRQTLMAPPYTPGRVLNGGIQDLHYGGYTDPYYETPERGDVSPVKSHKSAPATLSYAELEGSTPKPQLSQRQMRTPGHSRQQSHISRMSQASILSEPDSLIAPKRDSYQDVRTALSSPSRVNRSTEPTPSPQGGQPARPFSNGSTLSSALSTLYSMEEASGRSPPVDPRLEASVERHAPGKALSNRQVLSPHRNFQVSPERSPKSRFGDEEVPPPLRIRRGTLGMVAPCVIPAPPADSRGKSVKDGLPKRTPSFTPPSSDENEDDPFTVSTPPPQNPARLSKVFSPLPAELPRQQSDAAKRSAHKRTVSQESNSFKSPTPSPLRRRVLPSPRSIINSPTFANRERPSSPVISEAGLSSVYDSYTYSYHEDQAGSAAAINKSQEVSPEKLVRAISNARKSSRIGFRIPNYGQQPAEKGATAASEPRQFNHESVMWIPASSSSSSPPRRSMPSEGSIYSQDGDQVPPLRASNSTVKRGRTVRMSAAITELRRMNSQLSTMSDISVASSTVVGMRGGGFSPGKQSGGMRNYLLLGGSGGDSKKNSSNSNINSNINRLSQSSAGSGTVVASAYSHTNGNGNGNGSSGTKHHHHSPLQRSGAGRSRRGTVVLQGLDAKRGSNIGTSPVKHASHLITHVTKLSREEATAKRSSVESLYDAKGFLKG
ncbi:uncharacterized protein F4812DRAFT_310583 [Daldinia caldariorum]|uniref:uncharacterized protein n=1 Tax=Daldinia caldariorum TaxID=326644 RepID=UPI0020074667|nr:uncharacterized protein F4812DRAFT_310583 [Daldinia caldariorum]KAI1470031.1 hypothetical protein F4812DRAFT_310583 [Daldinia caldariorum]